jgi:hypothetical protein
MNGSKAKSAKLVKRGLCLAGVCSILLSLAATGCDEQAARSRVVKSDTRSALYILCPPMRR